MVNKYRKLGCLRCIGLSGAECTSCGWYFRTLNVKQSMSTSFQHLSSCGCYTGLAAIPQRWLEPSRYLLSHMVHDVPLSPSRRRSAPTLDATRQPKAEDVWSIWQQMHHISMCLDTNIIDRWQCRLRSHCDLLIQVLSHPFFGSLVTL